MPSARRDNRPTHAEIVKLKQLMMSPDPEVSDPALSKLTEYLLDGHIVPDPPLSPDDQRTLRGLLDMVTGRSVQ